MNIQSVAIASGTEADPAEAMVKVAASAEETVDGDSAVKMGNAEDSVAVTETTERMEAPVPVRVEEAAEVTAAKTEENGTTATGKTQIVSPPQTEQREKRKRERNGKSRASATASPREKNLKNP